MSTSVNYGNGVVRRLGSALALCCALAAPAHAALFDDEEARKQIAAEKKRVDDIKNELQNELQNQQRAVDGRLGKVEEALKNQALLDLFTQLEALKVELNKLRGQIEVLSNGLENATKRQSDLYLDLDTRLRRIEQGGGAAAAPAASAPAPVAPVVATGSSVVAITPGSAPAPGAPAASAPPVTVDNSAEARVYEAAQSQRRMGNYQGAIVAFQNFIKQYPKSSLAPRAQYWIGDSHFNLRDFKLAIASQQALIKSYADSPTVSDAMLNIASSQIEMGESIAGRKTLEDLAAKFPLSEAAEKAKRRLAAFNAAGSVAPAAPGPTVIIVPTAGKP